VQTFNGLIIDCDTGRDDALAIWLALALRLPLKAVVGAYGNTTPDNVIHNSMGVLALAGRADIPVIRGATAPLKPHHYIDTILLPKQAGAGNGLCNLTLPYDDALTPHDASTDTLASRVLAAAEGQKIDYVITGNATSFAHICKALGDDAKKHINSVTMWGGKLDALWATMPGPDFNFGCDPYAVQAILDSGIPARFMPMDTTWQIVMTLAELEVLVPTTPVADFAKELMIAHCKHFAPEPLFRFHDPSVIYALTDEAPFKNTSWRIGTDAAHPDFGRPINDPTGTPVQIYMPDATHRAAMMNSILTTLGFAL